MVLAEKFLCIMRIITFPMKWHDFDENGAMSVQGLHQCTLFFGIWESFSSEVNRKYNEGPNLNWLIRFYVALTDKHQAHLKLHQCSEWKADISHLQGQQPCFEINESRSIPNYTSKPQFKRSESTLPPRRRAAPETLLYHVYV